LSRGGQPGLAKRGNDKRAEEAESKHHHRRNSGRGGRRGGGGLLDDRQGGLAKNFVDVFIHYAGGGRWATNAMLPFPRRDFANHNTSRPSCLIPGSCFHLPRPCVLVAVVTLPRGRKHASPRHPHAHTGRRAAQSLPVQAAGLPTAETPFVTARGRLSTTLPQQVENWCNCL
jgi:hypothetical protein